MKISPERMPNLLPGEEIANIQTFKRIRPGPLPSEVKELEQMTNAPTPLTIGEYGPVVASLPIAGHTNKAFHRYDALFGRDSLRVAMDLLKQYPKLARSTLIMLAQLQGVITNDASEEEPGRIPHEVRNPNDPIAKEYTRTLGWQWPYYGSVDATPYYVCLLATYCQQTSEGAGILREEFVGKDGQLHTLADTLANAMTWIMGRLKSNTTGLLEFQRRNPEGIENQVWKDSWDSYFHADGTIANHSNGIASIEVQGLAYDALSNAAALYENYLHQKSEALRLRHQAEQLQATIFSTFWVREKGGYFSLGTDRDDTGSIRQLAVRASNMGHLLRSRLLQGDETSMKPYREALVRQLFSPELLCRNGVRTVASDEVRFRAGAYHDGSCWGWDTYAIAQGLDAQGYHLLADHLKQAVVRSIKVAQRYIEFTRGSNDPHYSINAYIIDVKDTVHNRMNRLEQPPQDMQAWTVAAMYEIELQQRENKGLPITQPRDLLEEEIVRTIS